MTTEIQPAQSYQEMERVDENQILSELKGEFLEQFVYSYQQGNRTITSLSYTGIKEIVRRRRNFSILDYKIEETENVYRAIVKIHDVENNIDALGASEADKTKPFAYVLALNKAERNAYAKLIPAKFAAELIAEKLKDRNQVVDVPPPKPAESPRQPPKNVTPPKETPAQQPKPETNTASLSSWVTGLAPWGEHEFLRDQDSDEYKYLMHSLENDAKDGVVEEGGYTYRKYSVGGKPVVSRTKAEKPA